MLSRSNICQVLIRRSGILILPSATGNFTFIGSDTHQYRTSDEQKEYYSLYISKMFPYFFLIRTFFLLNASRYNNQ